MLHLSNTGVSDKGMKDLAKLKNLPAVYLFNTKVTDNPVPPSALDAFRRGVALHPPGQAIWNNHLAESR